MNEEGLTVYSHSPFICPAGTVFDQHVLTCVHSTPEFNCADQVRYYAETENRLDSVEQVPVARPITNSFVTPEHVVTSVVESAPVAPVAPVVRAEAVPTPVVPVVNEHVSSEVSSRWSKL